MRRVCLLFNPESGRNREQRATVIDAVATALRRASCDVSIKRIETPDSAGEQALDASQRGAEIVFACGGDGTVHGVVQGLVFQNDTALGVIPLGSANALARHPCLSKDPVKAAFQQASRRSRLLPVGRVTYGTVAGNATRYFVVMAGAGADGALVYGMLSSSKQRFGRASYYVRAAKLAIRTRFASFGVLWEEQGELRQRTAVSAMAVRIADLGGAFSPMIRGGSLEHSMCRLAIATGTSGASLAAWFVLSWMRLAKLTHHVKFVDVSSFTLTSGANGSKVQVQADGEWLGTTPMSVSVTPDALLMLVPDRPV